MLTIFTPVYNRAYIIERLYESLSSQTDMDFEWIVVDDGSVDEIDLLMDRFIKEAKFPIKYFKQANGGKHRAVNRGVKEASGDFFFIVDSDDYITDDAVAWIKEKTDEIRNDSGFAGISGVRIKPSGERRGENYNFDYIDADVIDIRGRWKIKGDLAEIYKTEVLRKFPFPDFPGEKFCAEGVVWNRIASSGLKLRLWNHPIYICVYLADGLTSSNVDLRKNNPEYSMLLYLESLKNPKYRFKDKIKYAILYWRFGEKSKRSVFSRIREFPFVFLPFAVPGIMLRFLHKKTNISKIN